MKMSSLIILPLSLGLMLYPSLYLYVGLDDADTDYSGFPIPWNSDSLATSLAKDIYLIPLAIDLLFYLAVGFFLWRYLSPKLLVLPRRLKASIIVAIWLYGTFAFMFMFVFSLLQLGSSVFYWPDTDIFQILEVGVGSSV